MSTNPFSNDYQPAASISRLDPSQYSYNNLSSSRNTATSNSTGMSTSNTRQHHAGSKSSLSSLHRKVNSRDLSHDMSRSERDPIWAAQSADWPLVHYFHLPPSDFMELYRQSRNDGKALGIKEIYNHRGGMSGAATVGGVASGNTSGLMGKLIGTQHQNSIVDELLDDNINNIMRTLRPPKPHCIAASNYWIVAAVETSTITIDAPTTSSKLYNKSTNSSTATKYNNQHDVYQLPPLRAVSRWNYHSNEFRPLLPLPPPVITTANYKQTSSSSSSSSNATSSKNQLNLATAGRIMHVFVDPTGCHTIVSAQNGEAYYIHAKSDVVRKLKGFGPNVDGSNTIPGSAMSESSNQVQMGLTAGSYVTSIGWDRKRGTENSSKKILLGTSFGEIYEYSLNFDGGYTKGSASIIGDVGRGNKEPSAVISDDDLPILLVRLDAKSYGRVRQDRGGVVSGLHFERLNIGSSTDSSRDNDDQADVIVLAVTSGLNNPTRLHTYLSTLSFDQDAKLASPSTPVNSTFHKVFGQDDNHFLEVPGSINYADLKICDDCFAIRTEKEICYGRISKGSSGIGTLPYETSTVPVSIAITPHHFITLCETGEVHFFNRVAKKIVQKERGDWITMTQGVAAFDDGFHGGGHNEQLIVEVRRPDQPNQIWLWKTRTLVNISPRCEDRDVWKYSLEACLNKLSKAPTSSSVRLTGHSIDDRSCEAEFENAKAMCTNNLQKAVFTAARAKYYLSQDKVELAAKYMAQCPSELMPFAETCIQLSLPMFGIGETSATSKGSNNGLISYLSPKMQNYLARKDDVACTMLGAWLVELYLHERERNGSPIDGRLESKSRYHGRNSDRLGQFLKINANNMDAKTILRILSSHDAVATECFEFAAYSGDIKSAVNAALTAAEGKIGALQALSVLRDSPIEQAEPIYYKHAFTLLCKAPMDASKSFLSRFSDGLSATKLLPAFMRYEKKRSEVKSDSGNKAGDKNETNRTVDSIQIAGSRGDVFELTIGKRGTHDQSQAFVDDDTASVTYFEGAITLGCRSPAVYNYLVSLYVSMDDETPLYIFISKHVSSSSTLPGVQPKQSSPLDMNYALSTILNSGRHFRSAIKLYMGFGMKFRAVELAIKVDPVLAKELASESVEIDEKKRLWTMIARNAAIEGESSGGKEVVSKVLSVLNECGPGVLSIEDVLPFLPDVAQIDQFKEEICAALTSYSSKIEEYFKEMSNCNQTCNSLREEIRLLSDFTTRMCSEARCAFTGKIVADQNEPFYVFPSGYVALEGPLKENILPYLNEQQKLKLDSIEKEIGDVKGKVNTTSSGFDQSWGKTDLEYKLEALQAELDGLIAAECPLTGSIMIESIDHCFADSKEDELYIASDDLVMDGCYNHF